MWALKYAHRWEERGGKLYPREVVPLPNPIVTPAAPEQREPLTDLTGCDV